MSFRMLSWGKKIQKSTSMGNLKFVFCFEMTSYFGISLGIDIQRVCQFKPLL